MHRQTQFTRPDMDDEQTLMDHGLTRGIKAMQRTAGLVIDPHLARQYDVPAVALLRVLDQLPQHQTIADAVRGLNRRSVALGEPTHVG